ncbi:hypothetical protein HAX54_028825, partial [Datura stramonium]|nr:hypothetical protein [Datura stramonium]
ANTVQKAMRRMDRRDAVGTRGGPRCGLLDPTHLAADLKGLSKARGRVGPGFEELYDNDAKNEEQDRVDSNLESMMMRMILRWEVVLSQR